MKITKGNRVEEVNLDEVISNLYKEHETLYFSEIGGQIFIYMPLSRKKYKKIMSNTELSSFEQEDEICKAALLWPEDFDFDNCHAGIPPALYQEIITKSFLTNFSDMIYLIEAYREEAEELDSQMTCIISEAFPNYTVEEIEEWDMLKFTRMFTKSEWKLKNLRSLELNQDVVEFLQTINASGSEEIIESNIVNEDQPQQVEKSTTLPNGKRKMTPEMEKAYREAVAKFPEIDWSADAMFTGYDTQTVDTTPPALRNGWR